MKTILAIIISSLCLIQTGLASDANEDALKFLREEVEIASLLRQVADDALVGDIAFQNVTLVDPDAELLTPHQTVIVSRTPMLEIAWIGDDADAEIEDGTIVVDGDGQYLAPGLVDMHVHFESVSGMLLLLANGITSAREMNGYPWLLGVQRSAQGGDMLAPNLYVAGTIINGIPIGEYALVATSTADMRRIIRQQAACGYDFIKIHNILPKAYFDAAVAQTKALGIELVGHVPQQVDIEYALEGQKLRTMEHLKGFIFDRSFMANPEDFSAIMKNTSQWLTPTLRTRMNFDRGAKAQSVVNSEWTQFVAARKREEWQALLNAGYDDITELLDNRMGVAQADVMQRLVPLKPKWLVGTDAANEHFTIMGYALFEEMGMMQNAGVAITDIYRGATTEAARALDQANDFGKIAVGMRPDLVLLDQNPLLDPTVYQSHAGVMVNGRWITRAQIQAALSTLASIYSDEASEKIITMREMATLIDQLEELQDDGYFFDSTIINKAIEALDGKGNDRLVSRLQSFNSKNYAVTCAVPIPYEN